MEDDMFPQLNSRHVKVILVLLVALGLMVGCGKAVPTPVPPTTGATATSVPPTAVVPSSPTPTDTKTPTPPTAPPTSEPRADGLSEDEAATLGSLEQVDDYPLYTMRYYGPYGRSAASAGNVVKWACSLFVAGSPAASGDGEDMHYGRNFDWRYSPALLLFTDPPDGYASVSMVDIAYLGLADGVTDLPLSGRRALLDAPFWPFDGMNEHGLVVGMAAVPESAMPHDPDAETIDSLAVIREMLDRARDVDEALDIMQSYNIDWSGGPALHYLLADATGRSVLVEFYQGEMVLIPNETSWHLATNFLRSSVGEFDQGQCWRYDTIAQRLAQAEGRLTTQEAMALLDEVSQSNTQWSIVYGITTGEISMAMGRKYDNPHTFHLPLDR
jgi:hypothetical protein